LSCVTFYPVTFFPFTKIGAAYKHIPINSFDYHYSEQIMHIRLYLKLVLTYVHF